jgi:hypothetical protein
MATFTSTVLDIKTGELITSTYEEDVVEPSLEELASSVRAKRDSLLAISDWTQVADAPVDQAAWAAYRQALRDIPSQEGFPHSVVWPKKP